MIRPYAVRFTGGEPGKPRLGIVHTWTAFAAAGKFVHRKHLIRAKSEWVRLFDSGHLQAVALEPFYIAGPSETRAVYAADVEAALRLAAPGEVVMPGDHHDCLVTLSHRELIEQIHYIWPLDQARRVSDGARKYAPIASTRERLRDNPRSLRKLGRLKWWHRVNLATAICLAIADPDRVPALSVTHRHPGDPAPNTRNTLIDRLQRVHPDVDREVLIALHRAIGSEVTYPAPVLALIRSFCETLGEDPEALTWREIRALWKGGQPALQRHRIEGEGTADRFRDTRLKPRPRRR